jgi:hypothetical protein
MFKFNKSYQNDNNPDKPTKKRRQFERQNMAYYLPVYDNDRNQILGHLADISQIGMMVDCKAEIPVGHNYNLRLELMDNHSEKAYIEFVGTCKWCRQDQIISYIWNAGFEIKEIARDDLEIIKEICEKYSDKNRTKNF